LKHLILAFGLCLASATAFVPASAQPEVQLQDLAPEGIPGVQPGPAPAEADVAEMAQEISVNLRCPVCQGLSVGDSTSEAAVMMYRRVEELVRLGYTRAQIEDFFVSKYGEWILLNPRKNGLNALIWIGPGLALLFGFVLVAGMARDAERAEAESSVDADDAQDPFTAKLLAEVDDD